MERANCVVSDGVLYVYKGKSEKVKFTLEQATKAQGGSRGIAPLFLEPQR